MTEGVRVGHIYEGRVTSIKDFGAFVEILPGKDGLVHISEMSEGIRRQRQRRVPSRRHDAREGHPRRRPGAASNSPARSPWPSGTSPILTPSLHPSGRAPRASPGRRRRIRRRSRRPASSRPERRRRLWWGSRRPAEAGSRLISGSSVGLFLGDGDESDPSSGGGARMTPQTLLARMIDLFPEFASFWDDRQLRTGRRRLVHALSGLLGADVFLPDAFRGASRRPGRGPSGYSSPRAWPSRLRPRECGGDLLRREHRGGRVRPRGRAAPLGIGPRLLSCLGRFLTPGIPEIGASSCSATIRRGPGLCRRPRLPPAFRAIVATRRL